MNCFKVSILGILLFIKVVTGAHPPGFVDENGYLIYSPLSHTRQLQYDAAEKKQTYSLVAITPTHLPYDLDSTPPDLQRDRKGEYWQGGLTAYHQLSFGSEFVNWVFTRDPTRGYPKAHPMLRKGLRSIQSGYWRTFMVTDYYYSAVVHQFGALVPDYGNGLPVDALLLEAGEEPLDRPKIRLEKTKIVFHSPLGRAEEIKEVSQFLSSIPRWVGDVLEVKAYGQSPNSPHDFSPAIHRSVITSGAHWFGGTPVPRAAPRIRRAALEGRQTPTQEIQSTWN